VKRKIISVEELIKGDKVVYLSPGHAPGMVSTIRPKQNVNIATFEQVMIVSYKPPRLIIVISENCDTYKNIIDDSSATVGFPYPEYIQQAYDAGIKLNRELSELDYISGLSTYESQNIESPSIDQCWVNFECKLFKDVPAGDHNIVILDVLSVSVDTEIIKEDGVATRTNLPALYYTTNGNFFEPGKLKKVKLSDNLKVFNNGD
jgi:flavin reductase (DIM6/NTAB) family NADH-FMN oxidoreductase RutF